MYAPTRAGTRGGQGDFKWSDVKDDKDRENYLGHSVFAPKGRWQNGKDLNWYSKQDDGGDAEAERREEIRLIKEAEEDALSVALGFAPTVRVPTLPVDPNVAVLEEAAKARMKAEYKAGKEERKRDRATRRDARGKERETRGVDGGKEKERRREGDERERREDRPREGEGRERRDEGRREGGRGERERSRSPRRR